MHSCSRLLIWYFSTANWFESQNNSKNSDKEFKTEYNWISLIILSEILIDIAISIASWYNILIYWYHLALEKAWKNKHYLTLVHFFSTSNFTLRLGLEVA